MYEKISFEEACDLPKVWNDLDVKNHPLFIAANNDQNCDIYKNTATSPVGVEIVVNDDNISEGVAGFMICIFPNDVTVYIAKNESYGITDGPNICSFGLDTPLDEIIRISRIKINACPICGKTIPYKDQKCYSFAGRCCPDCLPEMRRKHEYNGWYN